MVNLPEGASPAYFKVDGVMYDGFIMPDDRKYIFRDGRTIEVFWNNGEYKTYKESDGWRPYVNYESSKNVPTPTYNVFSIVIGIIGILIALYLIFDGLNHLSMVTGPAAQYYVMLLGSQTIQNAETGDIYEIVIGIIIGCVGLFFLARYKK